MSLKFPWFALASATATGLGLFGLYWYESLSIEDKARADGLASEYAQKLYGRAVGDLTDGQRAQVHSFVKANMAK
jgi:hypothetical protein